jgi:hypothetical protein
MFVCTTRTAVIGFDDEVTLVLVTRRERSLEVFE